MSALSQALRIARPPGPSRSKCLVAHRSTRSRPIWQWRPTPPYHTMARAGGAARTEALVPGGPGPEQRGGSAKLAFWRRRRQGA
eukprot:1787651-Alexandrium_andersonii.AAC.1